MAQVQNGFVICNADKTKFYYEGGMFGPDKLRARGYFSMLAAAAQRKDILEGQSLKEKISETDWPAYYEVKQKDYPIILV